MRPIRGPRHASDDERTVEAPPEEPTLSAGLDVREAFEAQDKTVPGAVVGLAPLEGDAPAQDRTMPLVSPSVVRDIQGKSQPRGAPPPPPSQPRVAPPPPSSQPQMPATLPVAVPVATGPRPFAFPPPSDPVLVTASAESDADDDAPVEIPGVGGAQRKRMVRIVFGVLGVCALLCVAALARQLLAGNPSATPAPSVAAITTAPATTTATENAGAGATATATATPATAASSAAPAVPPPAAPADTASNATTAASSASPALPASPASPAARAPGPVATPTPAVATPLARAAAPDPPTPPARRQAPAPAAAPHPRSTSGAPAKKPAIVRDAPF